MKLDVYGDVAGAGPAADPFEELGVARGQRLGKGLARMADDGTLIPIYGVDMGRTIAWTTLYDRTRTVSEYIKLKMKPTTPQEWW